MPCSIHGSARRFCCGWNLQTRSKPAPCLLAVTSFSANQAGMLGGYQPEPGAWLPVLATSRLERIMTKQGKDPERSNDDRHEKARNLGEAALGKLSRQP